MPASPSISPGLVWPAFSDGGNTERPVKLSGREALDLLWNTAAAPNPDKDPRSGWPQRSTNHGRSFSKREVSSNELRSRPAPTRNASAPLPIGNRPSAVRRSLFPCRRSRPEAVPLHGERSGDDRSCSSIPRLGDPGLRRGCVPSLEGIHGDGGVPVLVRRPDRRIGSLPGVRGAERGGNSLLRSVRSRAAAGDVIALARQLGVSRPS